MPIALLLIAFALLMIAYPNETFAASVKGLNIWWDVLFPALFPFLVVSELMLGIGLVHFFGTVLDPLMRPLFRVPGIGGFVMAMGFASGYPVGARLTAQIREQKLVTRIEGERLVAFTTTGDPIFLVGAVCVGFFHNPALAAVLGIAHYGGAVILGLLMRFHGRREEGLEEPAIIEASRSLPLGKLFPAALTAMHEARLRDGRQLGQMMQDAVRSGIQLMLLIGGLVVFFSALLEVMNSAHFMGLLHTAIQTVLSGLSIPASLSGAVAGGLFEVTLGTKEAGAVQGIPLMYQAIIAGWALSWGGFSIHAQSVSLLHSTNLRYAPFLTARVLHGLISGFLVWLLWKPLGPDQAQLPTWMPVPDPASTLSTWFQFGLPVIFVLFASVLCVLIVLSLLFRSVQGLRR